MNRKIRLALLALALVAVVPTMSAVAEVAAVKYPLAETWKATPNPDRIVLTWEGAPATTQAVTWRTSADVLAPQAQIALATDNSGFKANAITLAAHETTEVPNNLGGTAKFHSVKFEDLTPETQYLYRVGDGMNWSEWFEFTTAADREKPFSFIYVGDAQNDILEHWSRVIRQAYSDMPDADFILHAGDLINRANNDYEWGEWFKATGFITAMRSNFVTPGNHEYSGTTNGAISNYWDPQFAMPKNGPEGIEDSVYYMDYQGVRFISLNSNLGKQQGAVDLALQTEWLDGVLANNPNQWTVVTLHHPVYSGAEGRNNPAVRETWKPLFDKYGVDLVLQGHDHTYARGHVSNLPEGAKAVSAQTGTVYVVSVSGPKMYSGSSKIWDENGAILDSAVEHTQLYQLIEVDGNVIRYEARTATGSLFDAFEIEKSPSGNKRLKELVPGQEGAVIAPSTASK